MFYLTLDTNIVLTDTSTNYLSNTAMSSLSLNVSSVT